MPRTSKYPLDRLTPTAELIKLALDGAEYRPWYQWAREEIMRGAPMLGCSPTMLAEIMALFSPRVSVLRSVRWSIHYFRNCTGDDRANRFAHDTTRHHRAAVIYFEQTGKIRGPKTAPFARALMGDQNALVLDTWMGKALGVNPKRFEIRSHWNHSARRVRHVARTLAWPVAETQAAIWAGYVMKERESVPIVSLLSEIDGVPI